MSERGIYLQGTTSSFLGVELEDWPGRNRGKIEDIYWLTCASDRAVCDMAMMAFIWSLDTTSL